MKKWFSFILVLVLAVVLIGCGGDDHKEDDTPKPDDKTPTTEVKPTSIEITGQKEEIEIGEEFTITVKVLPDDATNKKVRYSSSSSAIATIKDGKVTGISAGTATITVTADADKAVKKEFTVTVKPNGDEPPVEILPEEITINGKSEVEEGKSIALTVTAKPDGASNDVTWTSSDSTIASVDENGVVTGKKIGTVTITATTVEGNNLDDEKDNYKSNKKNKLNKKKKKVIFLERSPNINNNTNKTENIETPTKEEKYVSFNQINWKKNKFLNMHNLTDISLPCINFSNSLNSLNSDINNKNKFN